MKKTPLIILGSIIAFIVIVIIITVAWYKAQLKPANSKNIEEKTIEISSGTGTVQIVDLLKQNNLINNELATKIYIKLNKIKSLQAGKYTLNTGMTLEEIIKVISSGDVLNEKVKITFIEGKNMRWVAKKIAEQTNNTEQDVYTLLQDKEYIKTLIQKYWFLTDNIQNNNIYYPLEGYLYPDTYIFENKDVSVKEIFNIILNKTEKVLANYKTQIQESKYNVHQILTLGSMIELEGKNNNDRLGISSVFYNRLAKGMSLGSDVTTYYGIKVDMGERDLYKNEINTYNPYNTRGPNMQGKLPVGPICCVSDESINAALNPSETDYLYFVADMNGNVHFATTYEEHQQIISDLRKQGLWYNYE